MSPRPRLCQGWPPRSSLRSRGRSGPHSDSWEVCPHLVNNPFTKLSSNDHVEQVMLLGRPRRVDRGPFPHLPRSRPAKCFSAEDNAPGARLWPLSPPRSVPQQASPKSADPKLRERPSDEARGSLSDGRRPHRRHTGHVWSQEASREVDQMPAQAPESALTERHTDTETGASL